MAGEWKQLFPAPLIVPVPPSTQERQACPHKDDQERGKIDTQFLPAGVQDSAAWHLTRLQCSLPRTM